MILKDYIIENFQGFISNIEKETLPEGSIVSGLNWVVAGGTKKKGGDKVELRRGYKLLGADAGAGGVTGLRVGKRVGGTEIMFRTRARKIEYYLAVADAWTEIGTNSLPSNANGEDVAIEPYTSMAGYSMYFSSPNSSIYKVMLEFPADLIDMSSTSYRGKMTIKQRAMYLWDKKSIDGGKDKTGLHRSKLDKDVYSDYTAISSENIGTGDDSEKTFSATLVFKAGEAKRSCFGISVTDATETFYDNSDGTLTGDKGGTGTINYATGAISVTFNTAPAGAQAIEVSGYYEDPTSTGIADFGFSATRVAGEGFVLRQDDGGGDLQNIGEFNNKYYCFHEKKTWRLALDADDSDAANLPWWDKVGIPNWRAKAETGGGVFYIDASEENDVRVRVITFDKVSGEIVPQSISDLIDLSGYRFSRSALKEFGDYLVMACRRSTATKNDRMFFFDRRLGLWNPPTDLQADVFEVFGGALVGGDSTTNNVYELLSGVDDDDSLINNYITFNNTELKASGQKKPRRFVIRGEIQRDQLLKIEVSLDGGSFIEIGEVSGNGSYVDKGVSVTVGPQVIGKLEIGGGGAGIEAHPFQREINISSLIDKCQRISLRFKCQKIGYCSISMFGFKDIRYKSKKISKRFRQ